MPSCPLTQHQTDLVVDNNNSRLSMTPFRLRLRKVDAALVSTSTHVQVGCLFCCHPQAQ